MIIYIVVLAIVIFACLGIIYFCRHRKKQEMQSIKNKRKLRVSPLDKNENRYNHDQLDPVKKVIKMNKRRQ